jgi:hypothetical protein
VVSKPFGVRCRSSGVNEKPVLSVAITWKTFDVMWKPSCVKKNPVFSVASLPVLAGSLSLLTKSQYLVLLIPGSQLVLCGSLPVLAGSLSGVDMRSL